MNKNASIILAGLFGISLMIPGGIFSTSYAQSEYRDSYAQPEYSDSYAQPEYSGNYGYGEEEKKYSDSYGYEDKEKKYSDSYGYDKKEKKDPKLIIQKEVWQCLNPNTETEQTDDFVFCGDDIRLPPFGESQFVNCNTDREDRCLDTIKASDFQIDVIPAVQGSKHPINFDIDQTKYKVDEQFRLNDIGDILCFFANPLIPTHFNDGGIYETADERHFAVCADYVGDCDVNQDNNFAKDDFIKAMSSYKDYDNGYDKNDYKIPQKCTVKNYVFDELEGLNPNLLTQVLQNPAAQS